MRRREPEIHVPRSQLPDCPFAGLAGLKNGRLLDAAEQAGFDVLVTVDQNIPEQQNLLDRKISILILCGRTNRLRDLEPLVSPALAALCSMGRSEVVRIG